MNCMKNIFWSLFLCLFVGFNSFATNYYVDATSGNDSNSGSSEQTPWESLDKVNGTTFNSGDTILFKRGEEWHGRLTPRSGSSAGGYITYGAYGDNILSKPTILCSVPKNAQTDWENETGNIWTTVEHMDTAGSELITNPSFDSALSNWLLYDDTSAVSSYTRDTGVYDSSPASCRVDCSTKGDNSSSIQLYTSAMSITNGTHYVLSFRAKSSAQFNMNGGVAIHKNASPWTNYAEDSEKFYPTITTDWQTYTFLFEANSTATDARITFFLGNSLPNGESFYVDTVSLKKYDGLIYDIGNIIFDKGVSCGNRVWAENDLDSQGDFFYDSANHAVKIYSTSNPATYYDDIELAQKLNIIFLISKSYVKVENLHLTNGAAHGVSGEDVHHIWIKDCDISFIGGGFVFFKEDGTPVRYGNGVEFLNDANNCTVEGCFVWEIYDAALTNQGFDANMYNIYYRNNIVVNSEYSFEYWNTDRDYSNATTSDIYFENNTCINAGGGWGHDQRPNGANGRHLMFYTNNADTEDFYIRNNIFFESTQSSFFIYPTWNDVANLSVTNNLYASSTGSLGFWQTKTYTYAEFSDYQTEKSKDSNSMVSDPCFADSSNWDFHLQLTSPAIDAGTTVSVDSDFNNTFRPLGTDCDIGAYEYNYTSVADGLVAYWKLNSNTGGCALDDYGTFHGDIIGTSEEEGKVGSSLDFNGISDYVAISSMNYDEITVSAWFYKDSNDTSNADAIFGGFYWNSTVQNREGFDLRFYPTTPNVIDFVLLTQSSGGTKTYKVCSYDLTNSIGQWFHVAATYNKTTGTQSLYINGQLVDSEFHPIANTVVPLTVYSDMHIGHSRINNGYFNGLIDDVRIYNQALSAAEVSELYNKSQDINLNDYTVLSYDGNNQDLTPLQYEVIDEGKSLHLWGNNWKTISSSQTISSNTVIEFDFKCPTEGEVHAIGVDTTTYSIHSAYNFQIHGTQSWGIADYNNEYTGTDWKHYIIPIGKHFTGSFSHITFVNDDDASSSGNVYFKNIRIYTP